MSIASSKASASRGAAISPSAFSSQLGVAVALDAGEQEAAAQLLVWSSAASPCARRQPLGCDPGAGERRPDVLLAVVEVLDGDPPQLALEDLRAPLRVGGDRDDAPLDAHPAAAAAADRADDDRAAAVDVAVEQASAG